MYIGTPPFDIHTVDLCVAYLTGRGVYCRGWAAASEALMRAQAVQLEACQSVQRQKGARE